ncbi:hypothetical protein KKG83_05215 [Candidatus Micrarchaeota archaeon]|nr:hypothetical protein [Candidatus Micrarchaeota archaeon]
MISSLISSVLMLAKKPKILLPGILFVIADFIIRYFTEEQAIEVLFKFFEFSTYPVFNLQRMPFQLIASYPGNLTFLGTLLIVNSVLGIMLSVSIANFLFEKKSVLSSIMYSVSNIIKILGFVLFFGLMMLFSVIVLWIVSAFAIAAGIIGMIVLILVILLEGFVLVHFAFVPALLGKGMKIKEALKESWNFTTKQFISVILLLIGIMIINFVLGQVYALIVNSSFGENDLMVLVEMVFSLIILTYSNIVFPLFYLNKNK